MYGVFCSSVKYTVFNESGKLLPGKECGFIQDPSKSKSKSELLYDWRVTANQFVLA
jgi:hypothetical protein